MARIPIWPGSSSFNDSLNPTPFGFYDDDTSFRDDADKVATYIVQRLGYPLVDIELQDINIYSCFEEAVTEYGNQVYTFQIIHNLPRLIGKSTGSKLNQVRISSNVNIANVDEGSGGGGAAYLDNEGQIHTGSLEVKQGKQRYDLLQNVGSTISGSSSGTITIQRIYHYAPPAINRYFDPYAGTGTGIQSLMQTFGFGNYSPGVNFMLMPIYFDILKLQAIEFNDQIRKSQYHFDINGNRWLKLFPIPTSDYTLHFEYTETYTDDDGAEDPTINPETGVSSSRSQITDLSNAPYENPTYSYINSPGRQWIRRYALALAKEMLGSIRGKYQTIPIPGDVTTLDHSRLLAEAEAEKNKLIEQLREDLAKTSTLGQLEIVEAENTARSSGLQQDGRYQIYIH